MFDPIDKLVLKPKPKEILESPNFLLTLENYETYRKKTQNFMFQAFYMFGKKITDIIPQVKSQDKQNREKMPKSINPSHSIQKIARQLCRGSQEICGKEFSQELWHRRRISVSISHGQAQKWLTDFLQKKFKVFGPIRILSWRGRLYVSFAPQ